MTHILKFVDLRSSFNYLIPPLRLNLLDLLVMIMDLPVKLLIELLDLLISSIHIQLSSCKSVSKLVEALLSAKP